MLQADEKPAELFNLLLGINQSRIESYVFASRSTNSATFRTLFTRLADTSLFCRDQLRAEIFKLGGIPAEGTLASSSFFRTWLRMHDALMHNDMSRLVQACCAGEEQVLDTYRGILKEHAGLLNTLQLQMLEEHAELIREDLGKVMNLRSVFTRAA